MTCHQRSIANKEIKSFMCRDETGKRSGLYGKCNKLARKKGATCLQIIVLYDVG